MIIDSTTLDSNFRRMFGYAQVGINVCISLWILFGKRSGGIKNAQGKLGHFYYCF